MHPPACWISKRIRQPQFDRHTNAGDGARIRYNSNMTRILIRAGKNPFNPLSAYDTFDRNTIGNNNGNLLFSSAVHKLLSAEGVQVEAHGLSFNPKQAPEVSQEFDVFVLPLANAFRVGFENSLKALTAFIEKLDIPTVMLSGGAQSGPDGTFSNLDRIEETVKRFCRAVLRRSSHITVRGEQSANYIRSLGFNDVLVLGCPSMTLNGPGHSVRAVETKSRYRLGYNIESSKDIMGALIEKIEAQHDSTYFPQDIGTFEMMLWGVEKYSAARDDRLPLRMKHHQFVDNKAEFMLDPHVWIRRMRDMDLNFGPRIHGNVVSILAGTPSVVFAHDSRTQELSEYHDIPHFKPNEISGVDSLNQVIERADFTKFNSGHAVRFDKVLNFLHVNNLKSIYDIGQESARADYESRLNAVKFPSPQNTEWASMKPNEITRLQKQRSLEIRLEILQRENTSLKKLASSQASLWRTLAG